MRFTRSLAKLAAALAALALLAILLLVLAHTSPARRWALDQLRTELSKRGAAFDAASLDYDLLRREAWLRDVRIGPARMDGVHAVLDDLSSVRQAELDNLRVKVALDDLASSGGSSSNLRVGRLTVRGGTLELEHRGRRIAARIPLDSVTLSGSARKLHAELVSTRGNAALPDLALPLDRLTGSIDLDGPKLSLRASLDSAGSAATVSGTIVDSDRLALDYTLRSDVARFASTAKGPFTAAGAIRGTVSQPVVTAHVDGRGLHAGPVTLTSARTDATYSGSRVELRNFHVATPEGAVSGSANLALTSGVSRADLELTALELEPVFARFHITPAIAARATGPIHATWPALDLARADASADVTLAPTRDAATAGAIPVGGHAIAHISPAVTELTLDSVSALDATASGGIAIAPNRALSGTLAIDSADIATIARFASVPQLTGPAHADLVLSGTLAKPSATVSASSPALSYPPAKDVVASVAGTITLAGASPQLELTARAENVSAAAFGPATGLLTVEARFQGSATSPTGSALITAPEIAVSGEALGALRAQASLAGKTVTLDSLRLSKGDGSINATGSYAISTGRYTADARVERFHLDRAPITARSLTMHVADEQLRAEGEVEAALAALAPNQKLDGTVMARIDARAPVSNFQAATADVEIPQLDFAWSGQQIRSQGPVLLAYANRTVTVRQADLRSGDAAAELTGVAPLEGPGLALQAHARSPLSTIVRFFPETKLEANGDLRFDGEVKGSLEKPEPAGTLAANAATLSAPGLPAPLRDLQLNARIQDGAAHIDTLTALFASARIAATGDMPLPPRQGPGRFHATIDDLDLASIPGMPASLSGHTSARIEGSAAALDLHSLRATLTLPRLEFDAGDQHFEQDGESTIAVENGVATVQRLKLTGTETTLDVSGTAGLEGERPLALDVAGRFDAAILTVASANARAAGATDLKLSIRGPATKPAIMGFIETTDAQVTLADPAIAAENLALRTEFTGDRVDITSLKGDINGGQMRGRGTASIGDGKLSSVNLTATIADAFLEYPRGLKSRANAALALRGDSTALALTGNINVMEGSYRDAITIERGLLGGSSSAASSDLARVRWDVQVRTVSPIAIDNNIARAGVTADLHVVGTPARTALTGRVDLEQGGEVTLGERKYIIERGAIRFTNDQRIEPVLDLEAKTRVSNYDVTLHVEGEPGKKLDTTFTSDPALPEPDVVALVATGRTLEESRGAEADIAKEQLLSYLTAGLGGSLTGRAQQMLGLSQVRIEPSLIAAETEPTARLTLGQDLTRQFGLIYSMNLRDARDQIWVGRYDLTRRFSTRAVRQADNTYRFQFQHDVRFGGKPDPSREPQAFRRSRKIGKVSIETAGAIPEKDAANMLAQRTGRGFDFFRLRKGTDRVRDRLRSRGLLEATLHVDREETESTIDLAVHVKPGPSVQLVFEGWDPPGAVRKSVREAWSAGVFDAQRMRDSTRVLQQGLAAAGFLRGSAKATVSQAREKRVLFEIHPGERFGRIEIRFPGATAIKPRTLARLVKQQKLGAKAQSEPEAVIAAVERLYGEDGFLDARAGPRKIEFTKGTALIDFPVNEGQRYRAGEIRFSGATIPQSDLVDAIQLEDTVTLATGDQALAAVRDLYAARGYNNAEIELALARHPETARVDLDFRIREGTQRVLGELRVEGNEYTSDALIRNQIGIAPGQPVGSLDLSRARRNLYSTGAFALAEVEPQPTGDQVNLVARVREVRPWELRYGAFYDTERGPGGILDFANRNMLGNARVIGLRTRYDSELREARAYFSQPFLRSLPVRTVASTFIRREVAADFITDRNGVVLNEEFRWRGKYTLAAGYRFERAHTFEKQPDPVFPFDVRIRIAPVTATFARETRDDLLDATRGSFLSGAWEWGAAPFGSELSFVKYFGQYFRYFPLTKPALIPWAGVWRPRWVYAAGVRTGLAGGLAGQELVETEHFFAGGGTTVRGFEQNRLGPQLGSHATGGNAVFIMNHELRFPLWRFIDGVSFVDAGNVFARVADFRLSDLRTSAGLGLRLRTPYFVLRLDYGAKIDRRPGESFGRFFFSIGQAF